MKTLWQTRLKHHSQAQFRYLKLVFNDHFVLILIILLGALLYAYAQGVRALQPSWWLAPALALGLTLLIAIGRLASLAEAADATFLLPQTVNFSKYLFKARRYSLILPLSVLSLATLAAVPLFKVLGLDPLTTCLMVGATLWLFKDCDLWLQVLRFYPGKLPQYWRRGWLLAVAMGALTLGLFLHPVIALGIGLAINLILRWRLGDWLDPAHLAWQPLIAAEARRMGVIYRFYNMFTDVPGLQGTVRRRRYLDWLARLVPRNHQHTWQWLFTRSFLRRTEFLGLYLRLVILGAVVVGLTSQWWLAALLAALFVYLIGFQLLPLYQVHDEIVFGYLYPLPPDQKPQAFIRLVRGLLARAAVIIAAGAAIGGHWQAIFASLAAGGVCALGLTIWYLPLRLKKLALR